MITKNNWCTSNILEKLNDPLVEFDAYIKPYAFSDMSFDEACEFTCNEIYKHHKNLYLALSGGMDSEFILRTFHKYNIPIQPIIVLCGNEIESKYAFNACDELGVTPIVFTKSEDELFSFFRTHIYDKLGGIGYNCTQMLFTAEYVIQQHGVLITGNHFMGDGYEFSADECYASINEWDFYTDAIFKESHNIDFLLYTPEIVYASMPKHNVTWCEYKAKLFNVEFRDKIKHSYSDSTREKIMDLLNSLPKRVPYRKNWSRQDFFNAFESVKR